MLISVVEDYYDSGYLPEHRPWSVRGFFPNCNLAVRRAAWVSVDGYDEELAAAEDMDICRRTADTGWRLYFEPDAACRHGSRANLAALALQWWNYGVGSAAVQRKSRDAAVELYASAESPPKIHLFRRLFAIRRFPVKALVFATPFRLAGAAGAVAVAAAAMGLWIAAAIAAVACLAGAGWTVLRHPAARRTRIRHLPALAAVLATIDLASLLGGVWGGLRNRMLYVLSVV